MPYFFSKSSVLACLLAVAAAVLYGQFFWNLLVFDDLYFFIQDDFGNQPVDNYHFEFFTLRSLPYATLAWTKSWFGLDLIYFRIGNMALHIGVVLVLYIFLVNVFGQTSNIATSKSVLPPRLAAFFAALLFGLHPVSTYAVGYLVQRSTVMAMLFGLLALWAYSKGSIASKLPWLWLTVPLYYLSVFSKEHAVMLPVVLVALTVLLHHDWRDKLAQRWGIFSSLAVIALWVILSRKGLIGSVYELSANEMLVDAPLAYPLSVLTQTWLFFKYIFLWFFPNPTWMSIDMREPFASEVVSWYLAAGVGFLAWGSVACWLLIKRGMTGLAGFAMLYPWLMFMTELSSVRIQEIFVLYRSYLWAPGALCILPILISRLNGRTAALLLSALALAMIPISMERSVTLSHPLMVWSDAEKLVKDRPNLPGADRIYYNLGTELTNLGDATQAVSKLQLSISLNPEFPESHGNLGAAYYHLEDWSRSMAAFTTAIDLARLQGKPASPRYIDGRAQAYEKLGETTNAQADYREACRLAKRSCDKIIGSLN